MWRTAFVSCVVVYTMIGCIDIASGTDEYVHPHYTYSCAENKSIIIRGITDGGSVWIKNPKGVCTSPVSVTNQQALIPKNCTTPVKNNTLNAEIVTVTIWDKSYDGSTPTPTPNVNLRGGRRTHEFTLICHEIDNKGVFRVAERQMNLVDTEVKTDGRFEVGDVEMTFRKRNYLSSERLTHVYTGDEFFMFLNYKGTQGDTYAIMPKECFAVKGYNVDFSTIQTVDQSKKFPLWSYSQCIDPKAKAQAVMEKFSFSGSYSSASAKMYGFHFEQNQYISIVCNVTVCASNTDSGCAKPSCQSKSQSTGNSPGGGIKSSHKVIRRRSGRTKQADIAVFGSLRVSDVEDTSGVCIMHLAPTKVFLVFLTLKLVF